MLRISETAIRDFEWGAKSSETSTRRGIYWRNLLQDLHGRRQGTSRHTVDPTCLVNGGIGRKRSVSCNSLRDAEVNAVVLMMVGCDV